MLDTNVIYAALRSNRGASYALLNAAVNGQFEIALSVALCLEYEDVAFREPSPLPPDDITAILDQLVAISIHPAIRFQWRPQLRDPKDEMVLETAINGQCSHIVTFNTRDFAGCERFSLTVLTPTEFLAQLGGKP